MSRIARLLTGMTETELREYDYRTVRSVKDVDMTRPARGSVRLGSGLIIGNDDLDDERRRYNVPVDSITRHPSLIRRAIQHIFGTRPLKGAAGGD